MTVKDAAFRYPYAAAADVLCSHQKDAYFLELLYQKTVDVVRSFLGARYVQTHNQGLRTLSDLLYFSVTTLIGNQTLGEEYSAILQVNTRSGRVPGLRHRLAYLISSILFPYGISRFLPTLRRWLRAKLEHRLRHSSQKPLERAFLSLVNMEKFLLLHLDKLVTPAPVYALSLVAFYFRGAYYHFSKRLLGLRYIFTSRVEQGPERAGYELVGLLLLLQLITQTWTSLSEVTESNIQENAPLASNLSSESVKSPASSSPSTQAESILQDSQSASHIDRNKLKIGKMTNTPVLDHARYDLADDGVMKWIHGNQQRRCTLCLDPMKDPSLTGCGHAFCWICVTEWCREKPECPLCRSKCFEREIVPLRS